MTDALVVIDKPSGCTSHDVVQRLRRITGERSIGHLGTLDPLATGVLPLVLGRYTRLAQFFKDGVKTYEGEITFGVATDTYDSQGTPLGDLADWQPSLAQIQQFLPKLTGRILQRPPAFSAKKVQGVAAYKLARQDRPVELKSVEIEVHRFEILSFSEGRAQFVAEVSAGTYIRSLAHDLGQMLGCGAHLSALRRTRAGEFDQSQAITPEALERYIASTGTQNDASASCNLSEYALSDIAGRPMDDPQNTPRSPFLHPRQFLTTLPSVTAASATITALRNGRATNLPEFSAARYVKVFADQQLLVAIAERMAGTLFQPKVVLYGNNEPLPTALM